MPRQRLMNALLALAQQCAIGHPFPLEGGVRFGYKRCGIDGNASLKPLTRLQGKVDQRLDIILGFGGVADHKVELELGEI